MKKSPGCFRRVISNYSISNQEMSDLHRSFMKKIKQQESALGLSLLSEDVPNTNDGQPTLREVIQQSTSSSPSPVQDSDIAIIDSYNQFKRTFFTNMDVYTDETRSMSFQTYYKAPSSSRDAIVFCLHGAGSSSMTFSAFSQQLTQLHDGIGIFLFDLRGHGDSSRSNEYDILDLVKDVQFVLTTFIKKQSIHQNPIYLLGHSLGGAVLSKFTSIFPNETNLIHGLIMLDIVEETAVQSLSVMPQFIERRPPKFPSITRAIQWHMQFLLHNEESAKLSVPHLFNLDGMTWKTDLRLTLPYWESWFLGLADNFIGFKGSKLLILSAHETLDKKLIIGQMQGKYQLVVFNNNQKSGHFVHEDLPKHVSVSVDDFIKRSEGTSNLLTDGLGIVPKWGGKIHK